MRIAEISSEFNCIGDSTTNVEYSIEGSMYFERHAATNYTSLGQRISTFPWFNYSEFRINTSSLPFGGPRSSYPRMTRVGENDCVHIAKLFSLDIFKWNLVQFKPRIDSLQNDCLEQTDVATQQSSRYLVAFQKSDAISKVWNAASPHR